MFCLEMSVQEVGSYRCRNALVGFEVDGLELYLYSLKAEEMAIRASILVKIWLLISNGACQNWCIRSG